MVLPRFVKWALKGEPIQVYGDGKQQRCFGNVNDAIQAIVGLAEAPDAVGELFNIGSTEEGTIYELAERVRARAGSNSEIVLIPYAQPYEAGFDDIRRVVPNSPEIK